MSLIVEDGSGKSDAESYLSVADADAYIAKHGGSTAWDEAEVEGGEGEEDDVSLKEEALRMATQYLDLQFHARWGGVRMSQAQALDWPRGWVTDTDGYPVAADEIPQRVKDACAELALRHVTEDDGLLPDTEEGEVASESVTVGPVTESKTYLGGKPLSKQFRKVDALVQCFLQPRGEIQRA